MLLALFAKQMLLALFAKQMLLALFAQSISIKSDYDTKHLKFLQL